MSPFSLRQVVERANAPGHLTWIVENRSGTDLRQLNKRRGRTESPVRESGVLGTMETLNIHTFRGSRPARSASDGQELIISRVNFSSQG
ncbi:hypothetical protein K3495_g15236 [Podosphaera aphanis]|nr:hypothetical protein K3495_g15236 [Podosphaera aphanis]